MFSYAWETAIANICCVWLWFLLYSPSTLGIFLFYEIEILLYYKYNMQRFSHSIKLRLYNNMVSFNDGSEPSGMGCHLSLKTFLSTVLKPIYQGTQRHLCFSEGPLVYSDTVPPSAVCHSAFYILFFTVFVQSVVWMSTCFWLWLFSIPILEVVGTLRVSEVILRKEESNIKTNSTSYLKLFYSKCPRICGEVIS